MDSLGPELLLEIFDLVVHTPYGRLQTLAMKPTQEPGAAQPTYRLEVDTSFPDQHLQSGIASHAMSTCTPIELAHVCRLWRDLTLATPWFWSSIYITNGTAKLPNLLALYIKHSGSESLDIVFRDTRQPGDVNLGGLAVLAMIKMLVPHSKRWRTFKVRLRKLWIPVDALQAAISLKETPRLEAVAFWFNAYGSNRPEDLLYAPKQLLTKSPNLREVQMWDTMSYFPTFLESIPYSTLRTLILPMVTFDNTDPIYAALQTQRFQCLDTLAISLRDHGPSYGFPPPSEGELHLPSLRHLRLMGSDMLSLSDLVRNFKVPNLAYLWILYRYEQLADGQPDNDIYEALDAMLHQSRCKLQSFTFRDERTYDRFSVPFQSLLTHVALQDLAELTIGSVVGEDFVRSLTLGRTENHQITQPLTGLGDGHLFHSLPSLQQLHLERFSTDSEDPTSVLKMIASRASRASSGHPQTLRSVRVGFMFEQQFAAARDGRDTTLTSAAGGPLEQNFYFIGCGQEALNLGEELMFRDYSMAQDWMADYDVNGF